MSKITQNNLVNHVQKVTNLKDQFILAYKTNDKLALDFLEQMRVIHGCAIYDDEMDKLEINNKGVQNATNTDWVKLSSNSSFLYCIHNHIRHCDKLRDTHIKDPSNSQLVLSDADNQTSEPIPPEELNKSISSFSVAQSRSKLRSRNPTVARNGSTVKQSNMPVLVELDKSKVSAKIKTNATGTDEISLQNIKTESESGPASTGSEMFVGPEPIGKTINKVSQMNQPVVFSATNTSEYIKNLTSTEANRLVSEYNKTLPVKETVLTLAKPSKLTQSSKLTQPSKLTQQGGDKMEVSKPTLINYFADWCDFSKKFAPEWEEFKNNASKNFPDLQVTELNVCKDPKLSKIAASAGVTGYPTLVLFNNGYTEKRVAGTMTADDVNKFVSSVINE